MRRKTYITNSFRNWHRSMPDDIAKSDRKIHGMTLLRRMPYAETWTKYLKSQGYHLYVLSNYSRYMLDRTKQNEMPFLQIYGWSCFFLRCEADETRCRDIPVLCLSRFGLKAEETLCSLMTGKENCKGAPEVRESMRIQFKRF